MTETKPCTAPAATDPIRVCVVTSMCHYGNTDETYFGADAVFVDGPDKTARERAEAHVLYDKDNVILSEELEGPTWDPETRTLTEGDATYRWAIDELTVGGGVQVPKDPDKWARDAAIPHGRGTHHVR